MVCEVCSQVSLAVYASQFHVRMKGPLRNCIDHLVVLQSQPAAIGLLEHGTDSNLEICTLG